MKKIKHILMVFSAVFVFFILSNSVSAESIIKYGTQDSIEKAMVKVAEAKELSDTQKKSAIEKIMSESSKDALRKLITEKADKVKKTMVNDIDSNKANKTITKKIDNLSSISIENKDQAEDGEGNPIPEPQGQLWKAYGARMYTYTKISILLPYVMELKTSLINHYTVSAKGLTTRYLEHAHVAGIGSKATIVKTVWEDKSANKVGTDIDSKAQWLIEIGPGIPIVDHITEWDQFQKAYVKIVKWDKKKKKMYLNQHGKSWKA